jgi:hypothetical protein
LLLGEVVDLIVRRDDEVPSTIAPRMRRRLSFVSRNYSELRQAFLICRSEYFQLSMDVPVGIVLMLLLLLLWRRRRRLGLCLKFVG